MKRSIRLMRIFVFFLIFPLSGFSQTQYTDDVPLELFDADEQQMREALKLRDPFKRQRRTRSSKGVNIPDGPRTDFSQNIPSIDGVPLRQIRVVGVLLGSDRRALAKVADSMSSSGEAERLSGETYVLREGMKIGENDAELKAILPGGIVLVEKITNVYDQDEYLETIIPITNR